MLYTASGVCVDAASYLFIVLMLRSDATKVPLLYLQADASQVAPQTALRARGGASKKALFEMGARHYHRECHCFPALQCD